MSQVIAVLGPAVGGDPVTAPVAAAPDGTPAVVATHTSPAVVVLARRTEQAPGQHHHQRALLVSSYTLAPGQAAGRDADLGCGWPGTGWPGRAQPGNPGLPGGPPPAAYTYTLTGVVPEWSPPA